MRISCETGSASTASNSRDNTSGLRAGGAFCVCPLSEGTGKVATTLNWAVEGTAGLADGRVAIRGMIALGLGDRTLKSLEGSMT